MGTERMIQEALAAAGDPSGAFLWRRVCRDLDGDLRIGVVARDEGIVHRLTRAVSTDQRVEWVTLRVEGEGESLSPTLGAQDRMLGVHALVWATAATAPLGEEERRGMAALIEAGAPKRRAVALADLDLLARMSDEPDREAADVQDRVERLAGSDWSVLRGDALPAWVEAAREDHTELIQDRRRTVASLLLREARRQALAAVTEAEADVARVADLLHAEDDTLEEARQAGRRIAAHILGAMRRETESLLVDLRNFLVDLEGDIPGQVDAVPRLEAVRRTLPHWLHHVVEAWMEDRLDRWRVAVLEDLAEIDLSQDDLDRAQLLVPAMHPAPVRADGSWGQRIGVTAAVGGGRSPAAVRDVGARPARGHRRHRLVDLRSPGGRRPHAPSPDRGRHRGSTGHGLRRRAAAAGSDPRAGGRARSPRGRPRRGCGRGPRGATCGAERPAHRPPGAGEGPAQCPRRPRSTHQRPERRRRDPRSPCVTTHVLDDFVRRRQRGADLLDALADALDTLGLSSEFESQSSYLRSTADRVRQGRFVVLLLGCFSSGKSTLLNALLGQPVLPVKVNPCTAILTEVEFAEAPSVRLQHLDGQVETLSMEAFIDRFQLRTASEDEAGAEATDRFGGIDRAVVGYPLPLLRNGVVLLDTPGLDDDPVRTARTLSSLPDADAVIVVLSANRFLTELERRTLRRELLPLGLHNLFFPVTMIDLLSSLADDPEAAQRDLEARGRDVLGPLCTVDGRDAFSERFFPVDARSGLHARWDRATNQRRDPADAEALAASGLDRFEQTLETFLVEERGRAQLRHLHTTAMRIAGELSRQAELDRATASESVEQLRQRQEELEPKFRDLEVIAKRVARTVAGFIGRQQKLVWQDLRDFMARTEADLPDAVSRFDLGGLAGLDLLTGRGRARVEAQIRTQLEAWLEERVAEWQASLRPHMEVALLRLRKELAADAADFDALADRIVTDFAGSALHLPGSGSDPQEKVDPVERWFSVAMGAVLLSPGAMAAGWTEGYEGRLEGGRQPPGGPAGAADPRRAAGPGGVGGSAAVRRVRRRAAGADRRIPAEAAAGSGSGASQGPARRSGGSGPRGDRGAGGPGAPAGPGWAGGRSPGRGHRAEGPAGAHHRGAGAGRPRRRGPGRGLDRGPGAVRRHHLCPGADRRGAPDSPCPCCGSSPVDLAPPQQSTTSWCGSPTFRGPTRWGGRRSSIGTVARDPADWTPWRPEWPPSRPGPLA